MGVSKTPCHFCTVHLSFAAALMLFFLKKNEGSFSCWTNYAINQGSYWQCDEITELHTTSKIAG